MAKHITKEMWTGDFDKIAKPGDSVDQDIVDQFMNSIMPVCMGNGYLQAGSVYSHELDDQGKLRATYTTFYRENGQWIYAGHCFVRQRVHQPGPGDPWKK